MTDKPINLYYMKGGNNFGDILSKHIVEAVSGRIATFSKIQKADLVSTGSLLSGVQKKRFKRILTSGFKTLHVWGTGIIEPGGALSTRNLHIHAVRGQTSRLRLGLESNAVPLGDPGLLCNRLFPRNLNPSGPIVATPHLHDTESELWINQVRTVVKSDVVVHNLRAPVQETLDVIGGASLVITSAMHPLIAAHSYGVPVVWMNVGKKYVGGGTYKFADYYSVFGPDATTKPVMIDFSSRDISVITQSRLEDLADSSFINRTQLETIQDGLIKSFPREYI